MAGYLDDADRTDVAMRRRLLSHRRRRRRDADGYITYVGRADDVFKSSRLPHQPVRAGERAHRAPGRRRGGRGAQPRPAARSRCPRRSSSLDARRDAADARAGARDLPVHARSGSRPTSASAASSSRTCPRPSPARSAASSCRERRRRRGAPGAARVGRRSSGRRTSPSSGVRRRPRTVSPERRREVRLLAPGRECEMRTWPPTPACPRPDPTFSILGADGAARPPSSRRCSASPTPRSAPAPRAPPPGSTPSRRRRSATSRSRSTRETFEEGGRSFHVLDSPGLRRLPHRGRVGAAGHRRRLPAVSAADGCAQPRRAHFDVLAESRRPALAVVGRLDHEQADFAKVARRHREPRSR